jgi:hypothetical protein
MAQTLRHCACFYWRTMAQHRFSHPAFPARWARSGIPRPNDRARPDVGQPKGGSTMGTVIEFPTKPNVDNYFGGCPRCSKTDGYINIGRSHWFFCKAHRTKWWVGSNIFSSWREQTEDQQRRAYDEIGLANFTVVEPLPCELWKKQEGDFYSDVLKFVRGEPSDIKAGTVGEARAKIAMDLIAKNSSLALPENLQELIAAVEAVEHKHAVANGWVITLSDKEIAMCEGVARERAIARAIAMATRRALAGRP